MAALDFPANPTAGQVYEGENDVIYTYVGTAPNGHWSAFAELSSESFADIFVEVKGDNMTGDLTLGPVGDNKITLNAADGSITSATSVTASNGTTSANLYAEGQLWTTHDLLTTDLIIATKKTGGLENFAVYGDGGVGIGPDVANLDTNLITLDADGSITAAGTIEIGDTSSTGGIIGEPVGKFRLYRKTTTANNAMFNINSDVGGVNKNNLSILADGSVLSGGTLPAAPNITLAADGVIVTTKDALINTITVGAGGDGSIAPSRSTAVGYNALKVNTGQFNVAVGGSALQKNTSGGNNTGVGQSALGANTEGSDNTAMGRNALSSNTTGRDNIAIGYQSLLNADATNNVVIGKGALQGTTTGTDNVAVGNRTMPSNPDGDYNTLLGRDSGRFITSGSNNTILGAFNFGNSNLNSITLNDTIVLAAGPIEKLRINDDGLLFGGTLLDTAPNFGVRDGGRIYSAGGILVGGTLPPSGLQAGNITLNSSGAGVFSGTITCGGSPVGANAEGIAFDPRGFCQATRTTGSSHAFRTYVTGNGTATVNIYAGGDAWFQGSITASNVTFNLEADDDTKYTATTNEDGEQTLVYNGATLDMKEVGQALVALKSAAAAASDFTTLKSAIATALANL